MEKTLKCSKCGAEKPIEEFYVNVGYARGYDYYCKECRNEVMKKRRKNDSEIPSELAKIPARVLIQELRRRGYRGNLEYVQKVVI